MVKYGSIERQYMTGGVGMIQVTLIIRITLVLAFIMLSYWALQGIQIEKILRKGRVQESPYPLFTSSLFGWVLV